MIFYKFKLLKTGLKYLGTSEIEKNKKGILYVNEGDLDKLSIEVIINPKDMKEIL